MSGLTGAIFTDVGRPSFGASGDFAFASSIAVDPYSFRGVFKSKGGDISTLALHGDAAPGTGGGAFGLDPFVPVLEESGAGSFKAVIFGGNRGRGIFRVSESAIAPVVLSGAPAPGAAGATFTSFDSPTAGASGRIGLLAGLDSIQNPSALYLPEPEASTPLVSALVGALFLLDRKTRTRRRRASTRTH